MGRAGRERSLHHPTTDPTNAIVLQPRHRTLFRPIREMVEMARAFR